MPPSLIPLCCPANLPIYIRYTPDTAVILIFIQKSNTGTTRIRSRHGRHSFAHTDSISRYSSNSFQTRIPFWRSFFWPTTLQFNKHSWMASLSPSPARFYHLQMASLSPFPHLCFDECKFTGTLVSNPLLPSSRERKTCQSNSSGSRRLNRGNCCTPKFALSFHQHFSSQDSWNSRSS